MTPCSVYTYYVNGFGVADCALYTNFHWTAATKQFNCHRTNERRQKKRAQVLLFTKSRMCYVTFLVQFASHYKSFSTNEKLYLQRRLWHQRTTGVQPTHSKWIKFASNFRRPCDQLDWTKVCRFSSFWIICASIVHSSAKFEKWNATTHGRYLITTIIIAAVNFRLNKCTQSNAANTDWTELKFEI